MARSRCAWRLWAAMWGLSTWSCAGEPPRPEGRSVRTSSMSQTEMSAPVVGASVAARPPPAATSSVVGAPGDGTSPAPSAAPLPEASGPPAGSEPSARVHFVGRFDRTPPGPGATSTWSGTTFRARVEGTGATIRLDGAAGVYFEVRVDGVRERVFSTQRGPHAYRLFAGRPKAAYEVEVYRRNEAAAGKITYRGWDVDDGAIVPTPWPYRRRIEVLGDSITCGYGTEGPKGCTFSAATESAYVGYAAVAARALDASAHLICFSGKGLIQNYGGGTHEPMPTLYGRTLLHDDTDTWDFARYPADVVVVNLGTNDISAPLDHDAFVVAYVGLLTRVRRRQPGALIVAIRWAHWGQSRQHLISDAVANVDDDHLLEVPFRIDRDEGLGCDAHPSAQTHARLGAELAAAIEARLGTDAQGP